MDESHFTLHRDIELLKREREAQRIQKKGLMQTLLTGQMRVKRSNGGT